MAARKGSACANARKRHTTHLLQKGQTMTTLKEIAALAGVSRGTVDRVLNNRGAVKPETARRVREIAISLNYQPNKAALALASQKKKITIGVLLFSPINGNMFFEDVAEGVEYQRARLAGYGCTVITRRTACLSQKAQLDSIDELLSLGIHGLIISPLNSPEIVDKVNQLSDMGIPTITTNSDLIGSKRIAYVGSNYYEGGCTAAGLMNLITGGRANAGIVTGSSSMLCHSERIKGFMDTLNASYPGIRVLGTKANLDDEFKSYKATLDLLSTYPQMDALFFTAAGVYGGCRAVTDVLAENPGRKIKIISFDAVEKTRNLVKCGVIAATICQQPFKQGSRPIKLMFDYLSTGVEPEPVQYTETIIKIMENI